jgi:hypothetical protein
LKPTLNKQITSGILVGAERQVYDMRMTLRQYPVKLVRLEEIALRIVADSNPSS